MPSVSLSYDEDDDGGGERGAAAIVDSLVTQQDYRTVPHLVVNGQVVAEDKARQARPSQTLLHFLREVLHWKGSKLGCAEGGCGACTVMISRSSSSPPRHYAVNACLMPVLAADGCHVTTVEGVGSTQTQLHDIQKAMVERHGSQCGFCTPGIIVALYALFANGKSVNHIEEHMDGNLCRCTGYRPIWDAARSLCEDDEGPTRGPCGTPCRECPQREDCTMECNLQDQEEKKSTDGKEEELPQAPAEADTRNQKPLLVRHGSFTWFQPTTLNQTLTLIHQLGPTKDGYKIVVGNTEVGIETKFKHAVYPRLIYPSPCIEELYGIRQTDTHLIFGACTSLSDIQRYCHEHSSPTTPTPLSRIAMPIHDMLRWFASTQIRNVACLGGNLVTASPISDMNPLLASMGAVLVLASLQDKSTQPRRRRLPVSDFFRSYRTVQLEPAELVECIEIPLPQPVLEYVLPFKQARRREDDISIVTSGMRIRLGVVNDDDDDEAFFQIQSVSLAFGGMAPTTILAKKTAEELLNQRFCQETFAKARDTIQSELLLPVDVPGGQAQYRCTLVSSFLYQFYLHVCQALQEDVTTIQAASDAFSKWVSLPLPEAVPQVPQEEQSGTVTFLRAKKPSIRGVQKYPPPKVVRGLEHEMYGVGAATDTETEAGKAKAAATAASADDDDKVTVGQPVPHASGALHCTGEATYTDDIPLPPNTLQACLVMASKCNAKVLSIDTEKALQIPGVVNVYCHTDLVKLGGENAMGPKLLDEVLFLPIGERVSFHGQVLGVCVAETLQEAEEGARAVQVEYEELEGKTIVTIEEAIEANSFYDVSRHTLERGNVPQAFVATSDTEEEEEESKKRVVVSGSFRCGGQDHFYLETNSTLAVPSEGASNLTIYASTQAINKTQASCALATNTPASKVVVRMKRMGGGFGGKETRSVFASCAAAVAAKISNRPVRLTLSREVDMAITGGRHAFLFHYKASAIVDKTEETVELDGLDVQLYSNGGAALDLSVAIVDRAMFHLDGVYYWPHFRAVGVACKTVQPPHTAFRGFGGPQGMAAGEHVVEHLSVATGVDANQIRRGNMYRVGQATPFGMVIGEETSSGKWNVPAMWDRLWQELDVAKRQAGIDEFNAKHKWLKRGLSVLPTKFGIAFTAKFFNQGGALVHLYMDGTVLVTHGGTEMGQGLHTKVCQMAAQAFDIPLDKVYINDSSTDKVANASPTAASQSTDLYGMATLDACQQILRRLQPYRDKLGKEAPLPAVAKAAYLDRVDLSAHGFYTLDSKRCGYEWADGSPPTPDAAGRPENAWRGQPFNYFTQGVAVTEVEVEVLTGNHRTLSSDILVDVGSSINPSIDIGQIEGAFVQGMGWSTMEEVVYADHQHTWIRPTGRTFTTGPGTYKIPSFNDPPQQFNVSLLQDVDNPFAVHSSKAIGEPPFFLGCSVFYAIGNAVAAARKDGGYVEWRMPATSERIRMACQDEISKQVVEQMATTEEEKKEGAAFQPRGSY